MSKQNPEIFYKYRCFDGRSISMLANNQIYFASPLDFNDPFDCVSHEHMLDISEDSLEFLARLHPDVSPEAITVEYTKQLIEALKQHPEIIQISADQRIEFKKYVENLGVLALSARNDSILMWSHYANHHKGFCIGFKNNLGFDRNSIREVNYSAVRNNDFVHYFLASLYMSKEEIYNKFLKDFIFTKCVDWKYEQEWRIIRSKGIEIYHPDALDRIIFGVKMPIEERNAIRYILKNRDMKFFEAVKNKRHFSVEIRPV